MKDLDSFTRSDHIDTPICPPEERVYYRVLFGFDPIEDRIQLPPYYGAEPRGRTPFYDPLAQFGNDYPEWWKMPYRYEAQFPLTNDESLWETGVSIVARVDRDCRGNIHNVIIFRQGEKESFVNCLHTVAYEGVATTVKEDDFAVYSPPSGNRANDERKLVTLPPWGHFAALKSFVAGIAEFGVNQLITHPVTPKQYGQEYSTMPLGLNDALFSQILRALALLVPQEVNKIQYEYLLELLDNAPTEWLTVHRPFVLGNEEEEGSRLDYEEIWQNPRKILKNLYLAAPEGWLESHREKVVAYFGHHIMYDGEILALNDDGESLILREQDLSSLHSINGLPSETRLRRLSISAALSSIEGLEGLHDLRLLNLGGNKISRIEGLAALRRLTYLNFRGNQISQIENLDAFTHLRRLYLSDNQIARIEGLSALHNLRSLFLDGNQITRIEGLHASRNLTSLILAGNKITRIEGLGALPNLTRLYLGGNRITRIEGLDALPNLRFLDLSVNLITRIEGLDALCNIEVLHLSRNKLLEIPPNLLQLHSLTRLSIDLSLKNDEVVKTLMKRNVNVSFSH